MYLRKYGNTTNKCFISLLTFKEAYNSVGRGVLYNILIEFGVPMTLVRLIKMCLNETYGKSPGSQEFV